MRDCAAVVLAFFMAALFPQSADAAAVEWRRPVFVYVAQEKRLAEVIQEFAAYQNITAVVDKSIDDKVSVSFKHHPEEVIRQLTSPYGLVWYFDGRVLHVHRASEMQSKLIRLQTISVGRLRAGLRKLSVEDARFPLVYDDAESTVMISGPKKFVENVLSAVLTLDQPKTGAGSEEVRVFPLRYAWAQDKTLQSGGTAMTVPGVATLLKRLFQGSAAGGRREPGALAARRMRTLAPEVVDSPLVGRIEVPPAPDEVVRQFQASERDGTGRGDGQPSIEADGQMNAVIIRDKSYRMEWYTKLIETLDVKPARIEIEVQILDVEQRAFNTLGVRWHSLNTRSGLAASFVGGESAAGTMSPGVVVGSVLASGHTALFASVDALVKEGRARIVAQPKVLTLNNTEANLSNTESYYVKVAGQVSAELFNVTSGTRLQVTPLLSYDEMGGKAVKLMVNAQDGGFAETNVEQLPIVKTRDIQTQAIVRDGESLLIGGLVYETQSSTMSGVPGISKVPVLGALFRYTEQKKVKMERLFLITPRIIEY